MSDNGGTTGGYNYIMVSFRQLNEKIGGFFKKKKKKRDFKKGFTEITPRKGPGKLQVKIEEVPGSERPISQLKQTIKEIKEKEVIQEQERIKKKREGKLLPTIRKILDPLKEARETGRLKSQVVPFPFVPVASLPTPGAKTPTGISAEIFSKLDPGRTTTISQKISLKPIAKLAGTISGVDIIANWFAADNIATGAKIDMGRLVNDVKFGTRTPEEALDIADGIQNAFDDADEFITISTSLNPALWPFKKFYGSGIDSLRLSMENDRLLIEQFRTQLEGGSNNG